MTPLAPSTTVPARPAARVPTLTPAGLQALLDAARAISQPLTLQSLLEQVAATACEVLQAERASVWLADEAGQRLELRVARDLAPLHASWGRGVVGHRAATHEIVNVADAYADSRFNPEVDRASGFRTRSILALPLVDAAGRLVGVLQLLNKRSGPFDEGDENLATALAAPCAAALTRARMTEQLLAAERLNHELALASELQRATLPATMPVRPGYELHGVFRPASATGGDTYDAALLPQALLRMAFRLGAGLEDAFRHANDQLAQTLPDGRFVTAFVGLLDEQQHVVRFISGGQSPNLHLAADGTLTVHRAGTFPMGAAPQPATPAARSQPMAPGDWLALLSDGFYEAEDEAGAAFGSTRVVALLRAAAARGAGAAEAADDIVRAVQAHARLPQDDDMTLLLLRRHPA
jgi:phosphoserine phosphatase RsbU/P